MRKLGLLLLLLAAAGTAGAAPFDAKEELARAKGAEAAADAAQAAYGAKLAAMLDDPGPQVRRAALEHLAQVPAALPAAKLARVVELLDEAEPVLGERCLQALAAGDTRAEGIIYEQAQCSFARERDDLSNGRRAREVLGKRACSEVAPLLVARALAHPASAERLAPAVHACGSDAGYRLFEALEKPASPAVQSALLRLALEVGPYFHQDGLAAVAPLLDAPDEALRTRAALAVVGMFPRPAEAKPEQRAAQKRALGLAAAAFADPSRASPAPEAARLGEYGVALVPALVARLDKKAVDSDAVIAALAAIGPGAKAAKPALLRRARGENGEPAAVEALDRVGAALDGAEWHALYDSYKKRCARAGAIFMFSLSRDEACGTLTPALQHLAARSHQRFKECGEP